MRAVIYARVSKVEQKQGSSPEEQLERCAQYISSQRWQLVADPFVEDESGATVLDARPAGDALIDFLEQEGADRVVVMTQDRLARGTVFTEMAEALVEQAGAKVVYTDVGEDMDEDTAADTSEVKGFLSGIERRRIRNRTMRGKKRLAGEGFWTAGRPPFGWRHVGYLPGATRKDTHLVIDEREAATVRRMFELAAAGKTLSAIARTLTEEKHLPPMMVRPRKRKRETVIVKDADGIEHEERVTVITSGRWARAQIARMLASTAYKGVGLYGKHETPLAKGTIKAKPQPVTDPAKWVKVEVPAIVSEDLWDCVQQVQAEHHHLRRPKRFYVLSGRVQCKACGRTWNACTARAGWNRRKTDAAVYRERIAEGGCRNRQYSGDILEPAVWDTIMAAISDPDRLRAMYDKAEALWKSEGQHIDKEMAHLTKSAEALQGQLTRLTEVYAEGTIGKAEYLAARKGPAAALNTVRADLVRLQKKRGAAQPKVPPYKAVKETVALYKLAFDEPGFPVTPEKQAAFLDLFQVKVLIAKDGTAEVTGVVGSATALLSQQ